MKIKIFALVLVSVLCSAVAFGQEERIIKDPISFSAKGIKDVEQIIEMPRLNDDSVRRIDRLLEARGMAPSYYHHKVHFTPENSGQWDKLKDGSKIWRIAFMCHDATYIAIFFDKLWIPEGGFVTMYSFDKQKVTKTITHAYNCGRTKDNPRTGCSGDIYHSDTVVLEYFIPANCKDIGNISIREVSQGYVKHLKKQQTELKSLGTSLDYTDEYLGTKDILSEFVK